MDINKILNADFLDIIFDGKNKSYGAYDLRKTYNSRLTKALLVTASLLLLIFLGGVFANILDKNGKDNEIDVVDTQMAEVKKDEPPPPPPPPPPTPPPPPEIKQVKFVSKIEQTNEPDVDAIENIEENEVISSKTVDSDNTNQVVQAPVEDNSGAVELPKNDDDENKVFTKVEKEAAYPGGESGWRRYLTNNLDSEVPVEKGAPPGTYTVLVRFIVAKDGTVSDVVAETNHGYGMEQESVRAIKKSGKWIPGIQNGRNVIHQKRQPITWVVSGE